MSQQVARLSPHQNGKVFAVLMAVTSLIFILPLFVFFGLVGGSGGRPPVLTVLIMPVIYLVLGYVTVAIGCAIYNFMYRYIGGIEFEATRRRPTEADAGRIARRSRRVGPPTGDSPWHASKNGSPHAAGPCRRR